MKIHVYKKCKQTNDNLISILENAQGFTAITYCDSKTFATLSSAQNWLKKRGYQDAIEIEDFEDKEKIDFTHISDFKIQLEY